MRPEDFGAEPGQIEPGHAHGHHFDGAARQPEGHGPQRVGPGQIQGLFQNSQMD
jgi:hypothetical protein